MQNASDPSELFQKLAAGGDPSAFYALLGSRIQSTYSSAMGLGRKPAETSEALLVYFQGLYRDFVGALPLDDPGKWYDDHVARNLPPVVGAEQADATVEYLDGGQFAPFERKLLTVLERESRTIRQSRSAGKTVPRMARARAVLFAGVLLGLVAASAVVLYAYLTHAGAYMEVRFVSPKGSHSVAFPSRPSVPANTPPLALDTTARSMGVPKDTAAPAGAMAMQADTPLAKTAPRPKAFFKASSVSRPAVPRPQGTADSLPEPVASRPVVKPAVSTGQVSPAPGEPPVRRKTVEKTPDSAQGGQSTTAPRAPAPPVRPPQTSPSADPTLQ